jgi:hypothetical protein
MPDGDFVPCGEKKMKELVNGLRWHVRQVFSPETWLTGFLFRLIQVMEEDGYQRTAANPEFVREIFYDAYHQLAVDAAGALDIKSTYPGLLDREDWINVTVDENDEEMRRWRAAGSPVPDDTKRERPGE